jgi:acyl-CoA synthetase (AMP-forming)/AMP-acid ligase II
MVGYVDPALDEPAFDADGYLRTGDLGYLDADGYVVITGRLKDVIVRNGENVSAKDVEDVLYTHPKVGDVAVIGVPDERTGERVCAVVALAAGTESLTLDEIVAFARASGMRTQAIPERLEIVAAVPRNATGKALKSQLRERFGDPVGARRTSSVQ